MYSRRRESKLDIHPLLLREINDRKVFPFIGAGFSLNAKLPANQRMPNWNTLVNEMASQIGAPSDFGHMEIASLYIEENGRRAMVEFLRNKLHHQTAEPGEVHKSLVKLSFPIM